MKGPGAPPLGCAHQKQIKTVVYNAHFHIMELITRFVYINLSRYDTRLLAP